MAKKEDEFFRKLDKQKPIVKRKELQPLSSNDFSPRRDTAARKPAPRNPAARGAELAGRYNQRQAPSVPAQGLTMFGEEDSVRRDRQPSARPTAKVQPSTGAKNVRAAVPRKEQAAELEVFSSNGVPARNRPYSGSSARRSETIRTETAPEPASKGLSFRHELKYYINYRDYVLLKSTLKPLLSLDSNAGEDGDYHIRSLYFDDAYETALLEKMNGSDVRSKFRIRIYDFSDNIIKFEKKFKRGQYIGKTSFTITRDECEALIAGDCTCLEGRTEPLAEEIFLQMKNNLLRPRVIVDYHREAYVSPFENVRITFDKDIKAGLRLADIFDPHAPTMPVLEPGTMVLEVKFNRYLPVFIQAVLNNVNAAQRSAVSKYVLCRKHE